jgi:ADP-heptose:LPS heptosyltransferase
MRDRSRAEEAVGMQTKPRILVNRLGALGDVLLTTPIVRKLFKDRDGYCEIGVRTLHPEVFLNNPWVHRVYPGNERLPINNFDVVFNLNLVYERNPARHILDAYGFYAFGDMAFDRRCELFPGDADRAFSEDIARRWPDGYVVVHMRRILQKSRNLPEEFWRSLVGGVLANTQLGVVQVGAASELAFGGDDRLLDLRGGLSIHRLREVVQRAKCFVGVDSAPFHVAATTATPLVAFFTTARAEYRKPFRDRGPFKALVPAIDCYGCQERLPLGSTMVSCFRGDEECVNRFDWQAAVAAIREYTDPDRGSQGQDKRA